MRFVDTNVLLYSVSTHPDEERKSAIARELLDGDDLCLSVQVLQEFYVQATRSARPSSLTSDDAVAFIEKWLRFPVQETTVAVMQEACASSARWRLSYWDAAVITAARLRRCRVLLSEDLTAGRSYGDVRIVNPFA
jgi:predicted nucleic acid-binding protein